MAKARVVCNGCCILGIIEGRYDDILGVTSAKHPAFAPLEPPDGNLLVCPFIPPPKPVPGWQARPCEDCGGLVAVSPSSLWLLS